MNSSDEDHVRMRLRAPPTRKSARISGLVNTYLPEIQLARRNGKTWNEIGKDLSPAVPIKGDTLRKSVKRADRSRSKRKVAVRMAKTAAPPLPTRQEQLEFGAPQQQRACAMPQAPQDNNPFRRQPDPIRNHD